MRIQTTLLAALASLVPLTVQAVPITYTFEGSAIFSVTKDGVKNDFGDAQNPYGFTVTMTADTEDVSGNLFNNPSIPSVIATTAIFDAVHFNNKAFSNTIYVASNNQSVDDPDEKFFKVFFGYISNGTPFDLLAILEDEDVQSGYDMKSNKEIQEKTDIYAELVKLSGNIQWTNIGFKDGSIMSMTALNWAKFKAEVEEDDNGGGNGNGNGNGGGNGVPEPGMLALLGLGLFSLTLVRRRLA